MTTMTRLIGRHRTWATRRQGRLSRLAGLPSILTTVGAAAVAVLVVGLTLLVVSTTSAGAQDAILSPSAGAKLSCGDTTLVWSGSAANYWVYAGSTPGGNDYVDSGALGVPVGEPSYVINAADLPSDASTVAVRLWSKPTTSSSWQYTDTLYEACGSPTGTVIVLPEPGTSLLACGPIQVEWTGSADEYWLYAGSSDGAKDYFDSGSLGHQKATVLTGLPEMDETVNVRLWHRTGFAGGWQFIDVDYTACTGNVTASVLSPVPGTELVDCGATTVAWSGEADEYWLHVGSTLGGYDYENSNSLVGTFSHTLTALPADNSTIFVRLWYRRAGSVWLSSDFTYTACDSPPASASIQAPTPGTTFLICGDTNLSWTGTADEYWVFVSSLLPLGNEIYNSGTLGTATSTTITGLPSDGAKLYVTLYFREAGAVWQSHQAEYTACTSAANPEIFGVSPAASTTLPCGQVDDVVFGWTANADHYWVQVYSAPPNIVYFDSGYLGNANSVTLENLPTDGTPLTVVIFYRVVDGLWFRNDYDYVGCTPATVFAEIDAPDNGATVVGSIADLTWSGDPDQYQFVVGSVSGASEKYAGPVVTINAAGAPTSGTATIKNLPADGSTVYVTMRYRSDGGVWQTHTVQYVSVL